MKILICLSLVLSFNSFAKIEEEYFIHSNDKNLIEEITTSHPDLIVDHVSSKGFELYGPKGTGNWLAEKGVFFRNTKHNKNKFAADYPSFTEVTNTIKNLALKYPKLIRLHSAGKSGQGRDLWYVKISDNPEIDEVEPEVKYISSMHGDEITGRELMLRFIDDICSKYGSDAEITDLINNSEIFIMPSMNPDGSEARQRANANGRDINRNFPDWTTSSSNTAGNREVETKLLMKFQAERHFALSANFHGGAIVVNYPWDAAYDLHPFDGMIKEFSTDYANLNPSMRNSSEFTGGITNGAEWYVVRGGMQDWSYFWHGDLQITVELSNDKWPNYRDIPQFYIDNRESLINYLQKIAQGAGFKLGQAGVSGQVEIINQSGKSLGKYPFWESEFYKILPEGDYEFRISNGKSFKTKVTDHFSQDNGNIVLVQ